MLAVIGILGVLVVGGYLIANESSKIEALEQKSADIQREAEALRATVTPAPLLSVRLSDYVLPGHLARRNGGGAFSLKNCPSVRPLARWLNMAPQPALATPQPANQCRSDPAIDVETRLWRRRRYSCKGVGHLLGSANPAGGNMVLTAHNVLRRDFPLPGTARAGRRGAGHGGPPLVYLRRA